MDEGRLLAVGRSRNYRRKCVQVMNDIIKNQQVIYQSYLSKEAHVTTARWLDHVVAVKHALVRGRVLRQCLRAIKTRDSGPSHPNLGAYQGRPVASFSRDVDHRMALNHPRLRRLRQCEKVMEDGRKYGTILDPLAMRSKVEDFFDNLQLVDENRVKKNKSSPEDKKSSNDAQEKMTFKYRGIDRRPSRLVDPVDVRHIREADSGATLNLHAITEGDEGSQGDPHEGSQGDHNEGIQAGDDANMSRLNKLPSIQRKQLRPPQAGAGQKGGTIERHKGGPERRRSLVLPPIKTDKNMVNILTVNKDGK